MRTSSLKLLPSSLAVCLLGIAPFFSFAQSDEGKEKTLQLSVPEIRDVLVGKQIQYQSTSNGMCTVNFQKDGSLSSACAGGSGVGVYKIGNFDTKANESDTAKPRFCMTFSYRPNDPFCSILYRRADGSIWFSANKTKMMVVKDL